MKAIKKTKLSELRTKEELLADLDKRRPYALAVHAAFLRGDREAVDNAQHAFREAFPRSED